MRATQPPKIKLPRRINACYDKDLKCFSKIPFPDLKTRRRKKKITHIFQTLGLHFLDFSGKTSATAQRCAFWPSNPSLPGQKEGSRRLINEVRASQGLAVLREAFFFPSFRGSTAQQKTQDDRQRGIAVLHP